MKLLPDSCVWVNSLWSRLPFLRQLPQFNYICEDLKPQAIASCCIWTIHLSCLRCSNSLYGYSVHVVQDLWNSPTARLLRYIISFCAISFHFRIVTIGALHHPKMDYGGSALSATWITLSPFCFTCLYTSLLPPGLRPLSVRLRPPHHTSSAALVIDRCCSWVFNVCFPVKLFWDCLSAWYLLNCSINAGQKVQQSAAAVETYAACALDGAARHGCPDLRSGSSFATPPVTFWWRCGIWVIRSINLLQVCSRPSYF